MKLLTNRRLKVLFIFVLTYLALYVLSVATPLRDWEFNGGLFRMDWLAFFMPLPAFYFMYALVEWVDKEFEGRLGHSVFMPLVLFMLGLMAWYVVLFWYYKNVADLQQVATVQFDYVARLMDSHYPYFLLACFGGWVARFIVDRK